MADPTTDTAATHASNAAASASAASQAAIAATAAAGAAQTAAAKAEVHAGNWLKGHVLWVAGGIVVISAIAVIAILAHH